MKPIRDLRDLGAKSEQSLAIIGIVSVADIEEEGDVQSLCV
ncbi:TfoX/Sxy family protein [Ghiorsea bivora]|nr:TfoX/Sxy family protein [Ghiorsea bivora]